MLWNKQDPSVSEEAIRAIGWVVVHTEDGSKVCPERAMMSTAHLSFWDVEWAVTEKGPALVCGDTTLGYLNDERYVPQAVRVASPPRQEPCPDYGNYASEACMIRGPSTGGYQQPCAIDLRKTTDIDPCVKCDRHYGCGADGPQRMDMYLKTIKENPCRKCDHVLACELEHICTVRRAFFKNLNGCTNPLPFAMVHTPRAHNVVRMLREMSSSFNKVGAGCLKDFERAAYPATSEEARAKLDDFRKGFPHLDPITPAMQLVKDMALRNEETLASFKLWADRVVSTFGLIREVEWAMCNLSSVYSGFSNVGERYRVYKEHGKQEFFIMVIGVTGSRTPFSTAREAAKIIERLGQAPKARLVSDAPDIQDPCEHGLGVDRARGLLAAALRLQSALRRFKLVPYFKNSGVKKFAESIADQANADLDDWLNQSPSEVYPRQPGPPAPER